MLLSRVSISLLHKCFSKLDLINAFNDLCWILLQVSMSQPLSTKGHIIIITKPLDVLQPFPTRNGKTFARVAGGSGIYWRYSYYRPYTGRRFTEFIASLSEFGLKLKKQKCYFLKDSTEYWGKVIESKGLHAIPAKVECPKPKECNRTQILPWSLNYYGKFIKNLSIL